MTGPIERRAPDPTREKRSFGGPVGLEFRAEGDAAGEWPAIAGRAIVYDSWTVIFESQYLRVEEVIRPGAVRETLAEGADVRGLWNHSPLYVLGRNKAGTLYLNDGPEGLDYLIEPPRTNLIRELVVEPIRRKDVTGSSFAFTVRVRDGSRGERLTVIEEPDGREIWRRELLSIDLFDVSPVTYPAYNDTTAALRSIEAAREERSRTLGALRSAEATRRRSLDLALAEMELAGFTVR